jgi:hypothetical protein
VLGGLRDGAPCAQRAVVRPGRVDRRGAGLPGHVDFVGAKRRTGVVACPMMENSVNDASDRTGPDGPCVLVTGVAMIVAAPPAGADRYRAVAPRGDGGG